MLNTAYNQSNSQWFLRTSRGLDNHSRQSLSSSSFNANTTAYSANVYNAYLQAHYQALQNNNALLKKKVALLEKLLVPGLDSQGVEEIRRDYLELIWNHCSETVAPSLRYSDKRQNYIEVNENEIAYSRYQKEMATASSLMLSQSQVMDSAGELKQAEKNLRASLLQSLDLEDEDTASTSSENTESPRLSPIQERSIRVEELTAEEIITQFQLRKSMTNTPTETVVEFVEFILSNKEDHKSRTKDLLKIVKLLPESIMALGRNAKKTKLLQILKTSKKFVIGKKITKPKSLVIVRDHTFNDPTGEFERIKSPNPQVAHQFSVNMSASEAIVSSIVAFLRNRETVDMSSLYSYFGKDQNVLALNRILKFQSPKLLIRALLAWDGRFFWQKEGESVSLVSFN